MGILDLFKGKPKGASYGDLLAVIEGQAAKLKEVEDERASAVKACNKLRNELDWHRSFYMRFTASAMQGESPKIGDTLMGADLVACVKQRGQPSSVVHKCTSCGKLQTVATTNDDKLVPWSKRKR